MLEIYYLYSKSLSNLQDEPRFWNSGEGWGSFDEAESFFECWKEDVEMPKDVPDAVWVSHKEASKIVTNYLS